MKDRKDSDESKENNSSEDDFFIPDDVIQHEENIIENIMASEKNKFDDLDSNVKHDKVLRHERVQDIEFLVINLLNCLVDLNKYDKEVAKLKLHFEDFGSRLINGKNNEDNVESFKAFNAELNKVRAALQHDFLGRNSMEKALHKIEKTIKNSNYYKNLQNHDKLQIEEHKKENYKSIKNEFVQQSKNNKKENKEKKKEDDVDNIISNRKSKK